MNTAERLKLRRPIAQVAGTLHSAAMSVFFLRWMCQKCSMSWRLRRRSSGQRSAGEDKGTMICSVRGRGSVSRQEVGRRSEVKQVRFAGRRKICGLHGRAGDLF